MHVCQQDVLAYADPSRNCLTDLTHKCPEISGAGEGNRTLVTEHSRLLAYVIAVQ